METKLYTNLIEGWPTLKFGKELEMPELIDCMAAPFTFKADLNDAYKYGGEIYRYFIDNAPLAGDRKYTSIFIEVKFIRPGICPIGTRGWHFDGGDQSYLTNECVHTLVGDSSTLMTEFLEEPVVITDTVDMATMCDTKSFKYLVDIQEKFNFKPKKVQPNVFTTFSSRHAHRVQEPDFPQFRFFVQIRESNEVAPLPWDQASRPYSKVHLMESESHMRTSSVNSFDRTKEYGLILRNKI